MFHGVLVDCRECCKEHCVCIVCLVFSVCKYSYASEWFALISIAVGFRLCSKTVNYVFVFFAVLHSLARFKK
jgi:hypothetical protein